MPLHSQHNPNPNDYYSMNFPFNSQDHTAGNVYNAVTAASAPKTTTTPSSTASGPIQQPATFISKLYRMINDPHTNHMIHWSPAGDTFIVTRPDDFAKEILPRYFKHNNFSSFVRQLNMYGFHKVPHLQQGVLVLPQGQSVDMSWEFRNEFFHRDKPDHLVLVKRKLTEEKSLKSNVPSATSTVNAMGNSPNSSVYSKPNLNNGSAVTESSLSTALVPANNPGNPGNTYSYSPFQLYNTPSPSYHGSYDMPTYNNLNTGNSNPSVLGPSIPDGTLCPTSLTGTADTTMAYQQQQYDISDTTGYPSVSSPFLLDNNNLSNYNYSGGLSTNAGAANYSYPSGLLPGGQGPFDMGALLNELSAIKQKQNNIQLGLNTLENNQSYLHHELGYLKDRYNTQQGTMDKLLRFLANVFISGGGGVGSSIGGGGKPTAVVVGNAGANKLSPLNTDTAMVKKSGQSAGTTVDSSASSSIAGSTGSPSSASSNHVPLVQAFLQAFRTMTAPSGIEHPLEELHDNDHMGEDESVHSPHKKINIKGDINVVPDLSLENPVFSETLNYSPNHDGGYEYYPDNIITPNNIGNFSNAEDISYKTDMDDIGKIFSGDSVLPFEQIFPSSSSPSPSPQPPAFLQEPSPANHLKRLKSSSDISNGNDSVVDTASHAPPSDSLETSALSSKTLIDPSSKRINSNKLTKEHDPRFMALDDSQAMHPSFIHEHQLVNMENENSLDHRFLRNPSFDPHLTPSRQLPQSHVNLQTVSPTSNMRKYHSPVDLPFLRENANAVQSDLDALDSRVAGLRNFVGYSSPSPSPTGPKCEPPVNQDPYPATSKKRTSVLVSPIPAVERIPDLTKPYPDSFNMPSDKYNNEGLYTNPSNPLIHPEDASIFIGEDYSHLNQTQKDSSTS